MALAAGLHGYLLRDNRKWEGAVLVVAAVLLINPGLITDAIGLGLLALVAVNQKILNPVKI